MDRENLEERIWRIADGIPFKTGNMNIRTTDTGTLLVTWWIDTIYFENITKEHSIDELQKLKKMFLELQEESNALNAIVEANILKIEYHVSYDTGKGAIGICSEIDNVVHWYV